MKQLICIFLVAISISSSAYGQWVAVEDEDKWGEPTGNFNAESALVNSIDGLGYRLDLNVSYCENDEDDDKMGIVFSTKPMALKGGEVYNLPSGRVTEYNIDVMVDGEEALWEAFFSNDSPRYLAFTNSRTADIWRDATEFKMILPTELWGNLVYEFDMTGSRKAINKACKQ